MSATSVAGSRPAPWQIWTMAIRPKLLPAAVAPIIAGTAVAVAAGHWTPLTALVCLITSLLLQITSNLANDVFDFRRGADTAGRLGPPRVTQQGLATGQQVLFATGIATGLAVLAGLYLVVVGGWPILLLGIAAVLAAIAYTGGPAPLAYLGLGEVFVFLFFGLVGVVGAAYVQAGAWLPVAFIAAIPVGTLIAALLVINNLRDIAVDRAAAKRTIAVRLGATGARLKYCALLTIAYLTPTIAWLAGALTGGWWLTLLTLPLAIRLGRDVWRRDGRALNLLLAPTVWLSFWFSLAFAIGILL